jgi:hypothetical protein
MEVLESRARVSVEQPKHALCWEGRLAALRQGCKSVNHITKKGVRRTKNAQLCCVATKMCASSPFLEAAQAQCSAAVSVE